MRVLFVLAALSLSSAAEEPQIDKRGGPKPGEAAPDFTLKTPDGKSTVKLSSFRDRKPVVLIFGSWSCPLFRDQVPALEKLAKEYKDCVEFLVVYTREAHPATETEGRMHERNVEEGVAVDAAKTEKDREAAATTCASKMKLSIPVVLDGMDDAVSRAYASWPDRFYVIGEDGKVFFRTWHADSCRAVDVANALKELVKPAKEAAKDGAKDGAEPAQPAPEPAPVSKSVLPRFLK